MIRITALSLAVLMTVTCVALAADDELASAQRRASALSFINSLGVTVQQAAAMAGPLQRIQDALKKAEAGREAAVGSGSAPMILQQARAMLIAGQDLPQDTLDAIERIKDDLYEVERAKYIEIDAQMQGIADILTDAQNARLDWTAPASVRSGPTAQQRAQLQREIDARIRDAAAMLERVKYLDNFNFITARIPIIEDYLRANQSPGQPLPANAMDICLQFSDRARYVPLDQWEQTAPRLAADMITRLGLMPTL
ncbi:MAG: hypothetical protein J7M38_05395, partial [Armatimonadetes bacterium]|nr:hypothetical protein [Armatimonadota bacterium]